MTTRGRHQGSLGKIPATNNGNGKRSAAPIPPWAVPDRDNGSKCMYCSKKVYMSVAGWLTADSAYCRPGRNGLHKLPDSTPLEELPGMEQFPAPEQEPTEKGHTK